MKKLGTFESKSISQKLEIDLKTLHTGINNLKDHIICLDQNHAVTYIIDKICDHAGGKLIVKDDKAICPMHNWQLNLNSLKYNDSHVCKNTLDYHVNAAGQLEIEDAQKSIHNPFRPEKKGNVEIRWINHATVYIRCNGVSLITDPWIFGPAFLTGWWLYSPSPSDSVELLKNVDFVYISHNHPDHLHPETLAILDKNKPIITPAFTSGSSEKMLKSLGFTQIITLDFLALFEIGPQFQISLLKSGDFRDDSGIYICANGHELLLTVDANFLNSNILPPNIDLLMTSFAGGASGFPLCYENYSEDEKTHVIRRNKAAIKSLVINYIKSTSPTYYHPYAGMFSEYAERDEYVHARNEKNNWNDYQLIANQYDVKLIEPNYHQLITFQDGTMHVHTLEHSQLLEREDTELYIQNLKAEFGYDPEKIITYFKESNYTARQIVQIIPTDDSFETCVGPIVYADFYLGIFNTITPDALISEKEQYRVMQLKVRPEVMMCVVENYLPWEDMSIGFQMRATRTPNVYESDFWYHFTNEYIAKQNFRYTSYCGACTIVNQNPIWAKPQ